MEFLNSNTSQIEGLHHIYNEIFPNITDGFFVEVGAYDGYRWSNTLSLINNGWGGAFIEPHANGWYRIGIKNITLDTE